jgi:hypothetical protein
MVPVMFVLPVATKTDVQGKSMDETISWREAFAHWPDDTLPGHALVGFRCKEGLTQVELSKMTGIPQRHISEMEHGKRPIGKKRAKILAKALNIDYRIFL